MELQNIQDHSKDQDQERKQQGLKEHIYWKIKSYQSLHLASNNDLTEDKQQLSIVLLWKM